ncbi:MAG: amidohydrolase family protein [Phycisphaeraceae bacterium]|nr:amidohydrolase family protein [Phycisphaeraceae bacterium]
MKPTEPAPTARVWAANRLGLDYQREAGRLGAPPVPIIDAHAHINGPSVAGIYARAASAYGVVRVYSQTQLPQAQGVREVLGDRIRFVAIPDYMGADRTAAMGEGFLRNIREFRERFGACLVKFWNAPRLRDFVDPVRDAEVFGLESPWRIRAAELATSLGMMLMTHIADPDTWFATKYADAARYGTKRQQYEPLERMLDRFDVPWMAAHMGGWPEDLEFLSGLLDRHANLYLDTSATKWMVRELSRHSREDLLAFLRRYRGRILFGSDIVTSDEHLKPNAPNAAFAADAADSAESAFDLYASRYWALRTLWETDYDGPSPIADPDLAMVDPSRHDATSAPALRGKSLPREELEWLYHRAAEELLTRWERAHP